MGRIRDAVKGRTKSQMMKLEEDYFQATKRRLRDDLLGDPRLRAILARMPGEARERQTEKEELLEGDKFEPSDYWADEGSRLVEEADWTYRRVTALHRRVMDNRGLFAEVHDWVGHLEHDLVERALDDAKQAYGVLSRAMTVTVGLSPGMAGSPGVLARKPPNLAKAREQLEVLKRLRSRLEHNVEVYRESSKEAFNEFVDFAVSAVTMLVTLPAGGPVVLAVRGIAGTIGTKLLLKGDDITWKEIHADVLNAAAGVVGGRLAAKAADKLVPTLVKAAQRAKLPVPVHIAAAAKAAGAFGAEVVGSQAASQALTGQPVTLVSFGDFLQELVGVGVGKVVGPGRVGTGDLVRGSQGRPEPVKRSASPEAHSAKGPDEGPVPKALDQPKIPDQPKTPKTDGPSLKETPSGMAICVVQPLPLQRMVVQRVVVQRAKADVCAILPKNTPKASKDALRALHEGGGQLPPSLVKNPDLLEKIARDPDAMKGLCRLLQRGPRDRAKQKALDALAKPGDDLMPMLKDVEKVAKPKAAAKPGAKPTSGGQQANATKAAESAANKAKTAAGPPTAPRLEPSGAGRTLDEYLGALRAESHGSGSVGGRWDHAGQPRGLPKARWEPGLPIDMPNSQGAYPTYDTARPRYWRNRAHFELRARQAGEMRHVPGNTFDPVKGLTDEQLTAMARSGLSPQYAYPRYPGQTWELEHGVPQRVGKALEDLGLSKGEAARLTRASDPGNLMEVIPVEHAFHDAEAYSFGQARADAEGRMWEGTRAADTRIGNYLIDMSDAELRALADRTRGMHFGRTARTRELREHLRSEIAARGLPVTPP
jgi:hypothetical protein